MDAINHANEAALITRQIGRIPRGPYRVAARCDHGFPTVIVSPSLLEDGTPFPTLAWLTCPWLAEHASDAESAGALAAWEARSERDEQARLAIEAVDGVLKALRSSESGGLDACGGAGVAGARRPGHVKCVHARVALALIGVEDPVGRGVLEGLSDACPDERCSTLSDRPHEASV